MFTPNRYEELGPLTRPIIDRLINALASSPSTAYAAADYAAAAAAIDAAFDDLDDADLPTARR